MRIASLLAVVFLAVGCSSVKTAPVTSPSTETTLSAQSKAEPDSCDNTLVASVHPDVFCTRTSDCDAFCGAKNAGRCNSFRQCVCL